jgi:hypothetical protein
MNKFSFLLLSVLALYLTSCEKVTGDGPVVTQTRNVVNFSGIDLRVSGDVEFKQDPNYKVEVTAQQNILDVMETYVSNNRLVVKFKNDVRVTSHEPVHVVVSAPSFYSLKLSGSGSMVSTGSISPANMEIDISGSGNISIPELHTGMVDVDISGSGSVAVASGTATEEALKISGSGSIDLSTIPVQKANTRTSGSGDTRLNVASNLDVTISGSGNVYYKGNPVINASISGSGKVKHF